MRVGLGIPEYAEKDTKLLKKNLASLKKSGIRINGQYLLLDDWSEPLDPKVYEQAVSYTHLKILHYGAGEEKK